MCRVTLGFPDRSAPRWQKWPAPLNVRCQYTALVLQQCNMTLRTSSKEDTGLLLLRQHQ